MSSSSSADAAVAERLYYDSPALDFAARVTDIRLVATEPNEAGGKAQLWQVSLDRTAFYPESGGQPWDTGMLIATARSGATLEVPVERVEEDKAGEVWHFVRKPLVQGTPITGRVDADRRNDHIQQHSGQHLLSAVFYKQLGARTVSFHLGAESSTIDLALAAGMQAFTPDQLESVEAEANRLIFENRPLIPRWHTREDAEAMLAQGLLRKLPERSGPMRVVEMQGVEFNACGGTHAASTGAIGGLLLRRTERVKQGWRVEFVCGERMVRAARRDYALLTGVASSLSVGAVDLPVRVAALQDENKAAVKERRALLEELAVAHASRLLAKASPGAVILTSFEDKPIEFAKRLASTVASAGHSAVIGVTGTGAGAIALALPARFGLHAGNLLRELFAQYGARGGGSGELAQGICRADQVQELIAALRAQLG